MSVTAAAAFLLGLVLGSLATGIVLRRRRPERPAGGLFPADAHHVVDLLRRAHRGVAACVVSAEGDPLVSTAEPTPPTPVVELAIAAARLGMADGREHVLRDPALTVATGDGEFGCAVVLGPNAESRVVDVGRELSQLLAEFRIERTRRGESWFARHGPDWLAAAPTTIEGLAQALCEDARKHSARPTALAVRDQITHQTSIVGVSAGADRMLIGTTVSPESAVGRACAGDIPVVGGTAEELFGRTRGDRRTRAARGTAFPVRDGRVGLGALIVFGDRETLDPDALERVLWLTTDAGPRLGHAFALRAAQTRAETDPLTGLPNRRALEHALSSQGGPCSLLLVDLDHFKQFNDTHGHVAGDAALRHLAEVFRHALREDDLASRIGGEEFALFLPDTPLARGADVAERVRRAVRATALHWDGADIQLTCSVGVASVPESVAQVGNLLSTADAALYQAKRRGRDRVHSAIPPQR